MALPKLFQRIFFHNNTNPALNEDNFNAMSKGLSDVDDRVIGLAGTIMEDVPQIQEDMEELEADMALIDTKIASATAEANRATTAANNAAASVISAGDKALVSEGWAKGTQNGVPVGPTSPYHNNNSEYFKNLARSFTPQGYQDLVDDVDSLKETFTNFEESITGEVVDSEPYVLRQGLGNLADMALVGGSVAWNQLVQNGNFASTSGWNTSRVSSFTASNNEATFTASAQYGRIERSVTVDTSHVVLIIATIKGTTNHYLNFGTSQGIKFITTANTWQTLSLITKNFQYKNVTIGDSSTSGFSACNVKNVMAIDLTQMFGSTIADYIYSLEQATAGAGVAWFRQYFPNAYYGYQSGKIESVNPSSRKVVGKNLLPFRNAVPRTLYGVTFSINNDGSVIANGTATETTDFYIYSGGSPNHSPIGLGGVKDGCILTGCPSGGSNSKYQVIAGSDTRRYATDSGSGATLDILSSENAIRVVIRVYSGYTCNNLVFKPMIRLADTDATYEPYKEYTFPFDTSIQLRGIPKLVDNKLSYDGDIYTAEGSITRKYGIVDLGTLEWTYDSDYTRFMSSSLSQVVKSSINNDMLGNIICSKYVNQTLNTLYYGNDNMTIALSQSRNISIRNTSYTDAATFKTAMNGVYLVYELATPTTESANAYQNPQRAFIDGTEEFIDYGVQSATRDVSIPVGNNTTYQLNETLPPTEDYVDGALKFRAAISAIGTDESGRTTASRAYTTGEFFYKDGKMYKVLTSIAQGATFTINTNCQQTTLFAELKALAQ